MPKIKGVTFQLVHRSQQDPLAADDTAPQRVLVPVNKRENKDKKKRLEEQQKYGIYFDDDKTDYLEHLKDSKDNYMEWPEHVEGEVQRLNQKKAALMLPASVFPSEKEEEEGILSKAAPISGPQLNLDPDLVAAMDDDFDCADPENELEDNFFELADGLASDQEEGELDDDEFASDFDNEDKDEVGSLPKTEHTFNKEECRSRFTNYSLTCSTIERNEQLQLLDKRFEQMYAEYDDNQIGALECEEIEGYIPETSDILLKYAEEWSQSRQTQQLEEVPDDIKGRIKDNYSNVGEGSDTEYEYLDMPTKIKWDCKSILSTYSNTRNLPTLITLPKKQQKIKISDKTGMPQNVLGTNKLTVDTLNELNEENTRNSTISDSPKSIGGQSLFSQLSQLSIRPANENAEQRRDRKKALKDYRKERRIEKKANTEAFKQEAKRQTKIVMNNKNNVLGNKVL